MINIIYIFKTIYIFNIINIVDKNIYFNNIIKLFFNIDSWVKSVDNVKFTYE